MGKVLNLKIIKKSRLKQGDIFALHIDDTFLFGRVINDTLPMMGSQVTLVYIYAVRAKEPKVDITALTPDRLLLPPIITLRNTWSGGHAVRVASNPVTEADLLGRHCFKMNEKKYVDEFGNEIAKQSADYCGSWGITSLGIIDDMISDALNIKRAPLQPDDMWYISGKGEKIWLKQPRAELEKYTNYKEIVEKYPEVIEQ